MWSVNVDQAKHVGPGEIEERRAWLDVASPSLVLFVVLSVELEKGFLFVAGNYLARLS